MEETPSTQSVQTSPSQASPRAKQSTRVATTWVALAVFVVVLLLLLIFIIQNSASVKIHYFGASGTIGFGVAILLSAVAGAILTLMIGTARIVQLKVMNKRRDGSTVKRPLV